MMIYHLHRYMNAEKYNLDRIYFGGCFIRGILGSRCSRYVHRWLMRSYSRACSHDQHTVIRYQVLEQRHQTSALPSTWRLSVSSHCYLGGYGIIHFEFHKWSYWCVDQEYRGRARRSMIMRGVAVISICSTYITIYWISLRSMSVR